MANATFDPQEATTPMASDQPKSVNDEAKRDIVNVLLGYKREAQDARKTGFNPRDQAWEDNIRRYWNRIDFSKKANWQAKEVLPEVPAFVDRFASAMKEAFVSAGGDLYTIHDPADEDQDMGTALKRMTDVWLTQVGKNQMGTPVGFPRVFEEQMKLGAIMATASVVTWKTDVPGGRVSIDAVDPRFLWLDATGRGLYRFRSWEIDKHELASMIKEQDSKGQPIYDHGELGNLISATQMEEQAMREALAGNSQQIITPRRPIKLDEYIATVVDNQGDKTYNKSLFLVANDQHLIRGPEANPFWHGKDWLVFAPLMTVPLSPYGRSYMEDFGSLAETFINLTNMLLDAVHTASLSAWAVMADMLANPQQLAEGLTPNKLFILDAGGSAKDFAAKLDLGNLPPDAIKMWEILKNELSEAAKANEIGLGQFAPNSRTSATEILQTQQNSSAVIRAVAETVETGWLDPTLDLTWKTGLQHAKKDDKALIAAVGEEMWMALWSKRRELIKRPVTFQARGISKMIQKSQKLKALLAILQIVTSNEALAQAFVQRVDMNKFLNVILDLSDIDAYKLGATTRTKMIQDLTGGMMNLAQDTGKAGPGEGDMTRLNSLANLGG